MGRGKEEEKMVLLVGDLAGQGPCRIRKRNTLRESGFSEPYGKCTISFRIADVFLVCITATWA